MGRVVRIQAVARLDPEAEQELAGWRQDLREGAIDDPNAIRARLDEHAAGRMVIVRLDISAEVSDGQRISVYESIGLGGLWFSVDDPEGNEQHAREMVGEELGRILAELERKGIAEPREKVSSPAVDVVLGADLQRAIDSGSTGSS